MISCVSPVLNVSAVLTGQGHLKCSPGPRSCLLAGSWPQVFTTQAWPSLTSTKQLMPIITSTAKITSGMNARPTNW